jgi:hypothetical protein
MTQNACPECGEQGQPVERLTLKALLRPDALAHLDSGEYRFCRTRTCNIVYFAEAAKSLYHKSALKVRVGRKETSEPLPLCYCFGHTVASVREEIEQAGRSTAVETITVHIQAGRCGCDVNNPGGKCCLGEVGRVVKELLP